MSIVICRPDRMSGTMDLPRIFTIRESSHRIHNPMTTAKFAALGDALRQVLRLGVICSFEMHVDALHDSKLRRLGSSRYDMRTIARRRAVLRRGSR
ncbi:hypothetical protein AWC31_31145 [Mycolicibacterium wolinskyi]|uniref:Uncharacterized protein n=1 Tax=Mycolicibacterium wolinskyi TaxID=59750 RepID=A0A1X2F1Y8_9MYCO|nr:hypothetical protein AWC31_31145 [Mycolicibacterium wolinskyi]